MQRMHDMRRKISALQADEERVAERNVPPAEAVAPQRREEKRETERKEGWTIGIKSPAPSRIRISPPRKRRGDDAAALSPLTSSTSASSSDADTDDAAHQRARAGASLPAKITTQLSTEMSRVWSDFKTRWSPLTRSSDLRLPERRTAAVTAGASAVSMEALSSSTDKSLAELTRLLNDMIVEFGVASTRLPDPVTDSRASDARREAVKGSEVETDRARAHSDSRAKGEQQEKEWESILRDMRSQGREKARGRVGLFVPSVLRDAAVERKGGEDRKGGEERMADEDIDAALMSRLVDFDVTDPAEIARQRTIEQQIAAQRQQRSATEYRTVVRAAAAVASASGSQTERKEAGGSDGGQQGGDVDVRAWLERLERKIDAMSARALEPRAEHPSPPTQAEIRDVPAPVRREEESKEALVQLSPAAESVTPVAETTPSAPAEPKAKKRKEKVRKEQRAVKVKQKAVQHAEDEDVEEKYPVTEERQQKPETPPMPRATKGTEKDDRTPPTKPVLPPTPVPALDELVEEEDRVESKVSEVTTIPLAAPFVLVTKDPRASISRAELPQRRRAPLSPQPHTESNDGAPSLQEAFARRMGHVIRQDQERHRSRFHAGHSSSGPSSSSIMFPSSVPSASSRYRGAVFGLRTAAGERRSQRGRRAVVGHEEMRRRTERGWRQLPEVQRKVEEKRLQEERRRTLERRRSYDAERRAALRS